MNVLKATLSPGILNMVCAKHSLFKYVAEEAAERPHTDLEVGNQWHRQEHPRGAPDKAAEQEALRECSLGMSQIGAWPGILIMVDRCVS